MAKRIPKGISDVPGILQMQRIATLILTPPWAPPASPSPCAAFRGFSEKTSDPEKRAKWSQEKSRSAFFWEEKENKGQETGGA